MVEVQLSVEGEDLEGVEVWTMASGRSGGR